ncbi:MAG: DHH family phosphoesterase [Thermoplasmata archaeon]
MASGPDGFVSDPRYEAEFTRARELFLAHPVRWRVIYHYDGDGISSASSAMRALARLGCPAQATPLLGVERERMAELLRSTAGPVLVVDTGATWLDLFAQHPHPVVVLDHHRYPGVPHPPPLPEHVAFVNPLDWGVDGMDEMCASTLTWLFTVFLDSVNWDNAPWGLSGAIADRQHVGGFRGLNARLAEEASKRSLIVQRPGLALFGRTIGEALARSIDPYFAGLSGQPEAVAPHLRGLGIEPDRSFSSLTPAELARLTEDLRAWLVAHRVLPEFVAILDQPRWFVPALGMDAEELANLQNATGRVGTPGIGVALALGDAGALAQAREAERTWRNGILAGLRRLEEGGLNSMNALQWFASPDATLAGTQAGLAMNYLLDPDRPVLVFSEGSGPLKVSARGTLRLVARGLDLSAACRIAGQTVGGEGGGHRVASGATLPPGTRDKFLEVADREIAGQFRAHAGGTSA